jgi:predicted component of type VI protein secretion system
VYKLILRIEGKVDSLVDVEPEIELTEHGVIVGRKSNAGWVLPDPTLQISGYHFEIFFNSGQYLLRDTSTNGTFVNSSEQRLSELYKLSDNDLIRAGSYLLRVRLSHHNIAQPNTASEASQEPHVGATNEQGIPLAEGSKVQGPPSMERFKKIDVDAHDIKSTRMQTPDLLSLNKKKMDADSSMGISIQRPPSQSAVDNPNILDPNSSGEVASELNNSIKDQSLQSKNELSADFHDNYILGKHPRNPSGDTQSSDRLVTPERAITLERNDLSKVESEERLFLLGFLKGAKIEDISDLKIPLHELGQMLGQSVASSTAEMIQILKAPAAVKYLDAQTEQIKRSLK